MSLTNAPSGFKLVGHLFNSVPQIRPYVFAAAETNNAFVGDAVLTDATNGADATTGFPCCTVATASSTYLRGVIIGFIPDATKASLTLEEVYRPASTRQVALICDDPFAIYECQCSGTPTDTDFGKNSKLTAATAGSTTTGKSGMQLDETQVTTSAAQLRILRYSPTVDYADVQQYSKLLVTFNPHELVTSTGV